jgi:hypothetical protein
MNLSVRLAIGLPNRIGGFQVMKFETISKIHIQTKSLPLEVKVLNMGLIDMWFGRCVGELESSEEVEECRDTLNNIRRQKVVCKQFPM